jgi:hypothetical protein
MRAQAVQQAKQLKRMADCLAARNQAEGVPLVPNAVPDGIRVGDKVLWDDPDGQITRGWEVVRAPEPDADGRVPEDGVYAIRCAARGSEAEAPAWELIPDRPGGRA